MRHDEKKTLTPRDYIRYVSKVTGEKIAETEKEGNHIVILGKSPNATMGHGLTIDEAYSSLREFVKDFYTFV